jgi:hypothetical protein
MRPILGVHAVVVERAGGGSVRIEETFPAGHRVDIVLPKVAAASPWAPHVEQRLGTDADVEALQQALVGFRVKWPSSAVPPPVEVRLPTSLSKICDKATGDVATVCKEYETLLRQTEYEKRRALTRLDALTRGGVVEVLQ